MDILTDQINAKTSYWTNIVLFDSLINSTVSLIVEYLYIYLNKFHVI